MHRAFYYRNKRHSRTKYVYYIRGRKLAIVEWDGEDWISPKTTNTFLAEQNGADIEPTGGFLLEYTYLPSLPASEINDVDLDELGCQALIAYMKASKLEDSGDLEGAQYYFRKFKKLAQMSRSNKFAGIRINAPLNIHAVV